MLTVAISFKYSWEFLENVRSRRFIAPLKLVSDALDKTKLNVVVNRNVVTRTSFSTQLFVPQVYGDHYYPSRLAQSQMTSKYEWDI